MKGFRYFRCLSCVTYQAVDDEVDGGVDDGEVARHEVCEPLAREGQFHFGTNYQFYMLDESLVKLIYLAYFFLHIFFASLYSFDILMLKKLN